MYVVDEMGGGVRRWLRIRERSSGGRVVSDGRCDSCCAGAFRGGVEYVS